MDAIAGMKPTPRRVQGPGFELVGLDGDKGLHTALWLPPSSPLRSEGLSMPDVARAFLARPGIPGLARLVQVDRDQQAAIYATGEVWTVAEVASSLRRRGQAPGMRAGVELAWRVADLLSRAERESAGLGLRGHGGIDPWRLALRRDGQVQVLGYGLGVGKAVARVKGPELAEALRYAPPERLTGRAEDASSDLFSLTLCALEWVLGEPVYVGAVDALRRQAIEAEGDHRLYAWRGRLPADLVETFGRAIRRDADARFNDPAVFRDALRRVLSNPALDGPSLHQLLAGGVGGGAGSAAVLDPAARFVGLGELRGDVDQRAPAMPGADAPDEGGSAARPALAERTHEVGVGAGPVRSERYVSLGGRAGSQAKRAHELTSEPAAEVAGAPPARRDDGWRRPTDRTPEVTARRPRVAVEGEAPPSDVAPEEASGQAPPAPREIHAAPEGGDAPVEDSLAGRPLGPAVEIAAEAALAALRGSGPATRWVEDDEPTGPVGASSRASRAAFSVPDPEPFDDVALEEVREEPPAAPVPAPAEGDDTAQTGRTTRARVARPVTHSRVVEAASTPALPAAASPAASSPAAVSPAASSPAAAAPAPADAVPAPEAPAAEPVTVPTARGAPDKARASAAPDQATGGKRVPVRDAAARAAASTEPAATPVDAPGERARVRGRRGDDEPTQLVQRSRDVLRLAVRTPSGGPGGGTSISFLVVDGDLSAVEAVAQWVADRNLAATDLMGHTLYGWRFARHGAPVPDDRPVRELGSDPVDLLRVPNRAVLVEVVARDPGGDAWLTAPVGSAVPCRRIVSALVQAFGLTGSGWRLRVGGRTCAPDALLEGRVEDGGTVELVR